MKKVLYLILFIFCFFLVVSCRNNTVVLQNDSDYVAINSYYNSQSNEYLFLNNAVKRYEFFDKNMNSTDKGIFLITRDLDKIFFISKLNDSYKSYDLLSKNDKELHYTDENDNYLWDKTDKVLHPSEKFRLYQVDNYVEYGKNGLKVLGDSTWTNQNSNILFGDFMVNKIDGLYTTSRGDIGYLDFFNNNTEFVVISEKDNYFIVGEVLVLNSDIFSIRGAFNTYEDSYKIKRYIERTFIRKQE